MSSLLTQDDGLDNDRRRMIIGARPDDGAIEMEFIMTSEEENNLQDRLAYLDEQPEIQDEREISFVCCGITPTLSSIASITT